jgi:hypothetical protein
MFTMHMQARDYLRVPYFVHDIATFLVVADAALWEKRRMHQSMPVDFADSVAPAPICIRDA